MEPKLVADDSLMRMVTAMSNYAISLANSEAEKHVEELVKTFKNDEDWTLCIEDLRKKVEDASEELELKYRDYRRESTFASGCMWLISLNNYENVKMQLSNIRDSSMKSK